MKNFPAVMFVVVWLLIGVAFFNSSCASQTELERARAETVRQEVNLEQAKAATTIANADAFTEKSWAAFPYAMIAIFVGAGVLVFCAWYLRRSEAPRGYWQEQPAQRAVQVAAPSQPAQLPPPIVINLMLPGSADTRPLRQTYYSDYQSNQPYLIEAQPTTREVARLVD
jgi:hypothetical protein